MRLKTIIVNASQVEEDSFIWDRNLRCWHFIDFVEYADNMVHLISELAIDKSGIVEIDRVYKKTDKIEVLYCYDASSLYYQSLVAKNPKILKS